MNGFIHLQGKDLNRDDVNKFYFILSSYQDHLDSTNENLKPNNQYWDGKGELALFGVLSPEDITKKAAIKVLLKHLNADQKDTISFGDARICATIMQQREEAVDYITDDVGFEYLNLIKYIICYLFHI